MSQSLPQTPCEFQTPAAEIASHKSGISLYTPSNMDRETRERIFVQRHQVLKQAVRWCEESMLTGDKHHVLYIGPRGCGKTHLVSMIHDRVSANPKLVDKMRIAWLGEDTVFTGLIDLALEIADELSKAYPDEFTFDYREGARGLPPDEAAEQILGEIVNRLGDRSILLIMENLDRAMRGLGDSGQKKWRAFLQEQTRVATVATSQQLFDDVSNRSAPFYGFFEIIHLEPLSVENARELMTKIAREGGKSDLVEFLGTSEGRYRVRALHHLAGGNHRMYVLLSEFLTKQSLDGLVACFEELADELTPYFQERIRSLSPQQARIVQTLCNAEGAMTVKKVAEESFIPERNVSKQLGELRQKGYVRSEKRGKESYYDMAEPLMRLCMEVKNQRGEPLRLVAGFLRVWYSDEELWDELDYSRDERQHNVRISAYLESVLGADSDSRVFQGVCDRMQEELLCHLDDRQFTKAMEIVEEITCANRPDGLINRSLVHKEQGLLDQAMNDLDEAILLPDMTISQMAWALYERGSLLAARGDLEDAISDYSSAISRQELPVDLAATMLLGRARAYGLLGEYEKAARDFSHVIQTEQASKDERVDAILGMASCGMLTGSTSLALAQCDKVVATQGASADARGSALILRGVLHELDDNSAEAIVDYSDAWKTEEMSQELRYCAMALRAILYRRCEQYELASRDFNAIAEMPDTIASPLARVPILFDLAESTVPVQPIEKVIAYLRLAFEENSREGRVHCGEPTSIPRLILVREHHSWPEFIEKLIPIYAEYNSLELLGGGLTQSIAALDGGDYSHSQLDLWKSSWQKFGAGHEELSIPLKALDAAVETIKGGNDRPLFRLPLEIRKLVRPLLKKTLGEE